jgi:uncharacterized protein YgiB involved in biofilm formation
MKLLKIIIATALLAIPLSLGAQTKAETSLYGKTIKNVFITDSGLYLMIYNDPAASDTNSDNYNKMQECVKAFKSFESEVKASSEKATEEATEEEPEKATVKTDKND